MTEHLEFGTASKEAIKQMYCATAKGFSEIFILLNWMTNN